MTTMKKLLLLLFSILFLSSPSVFADDISDFQIEGISIGDSLLDYMTEDEILKEIEKTKGYYQWLKEPNKYAEVYLNKDYPTYDDGLSVLVKNNSANQYVSNKNEKYTILKVRGMIRYVEDFDNCIVKRDEIAEVLSGMFPNTPKDEFSYSHDSDPSGKSMKSDVYFTFNSGDEIEVSCDNFEETFRIKKNWTEGLNVIIRSAESNKWMLDG
jgi:hypothetical protein